MKTQKLTRLSLLAGVALVIFVVEQQIPPLTPIPGIKLGLANAVTLYAIRREGVGPAAMVLAVRVLLGNLICGTVAAMLYALAGALCAFALMALLRRRIPQTWVLSVFGALGHSIGQMAAALLLTGTPALVVYLPVMLLSSLVTGAFTGLCVAVLLARLPQRQLK